MKSSLALIMFALVAALQSTTTLGKDLSYPELAQSKMRELRNWIDLLKTRNFFILEQLDDTFEKNLTTINERGSFVTSYLMTNLKQGVENVVEIANKHDIYIDHCIQNINYGLKDFSKETESFIADVESDVLKKYKVMKGQFNEAAQYVEDGYKQLEESLGEYDTDEYIGMMLDSVEKFQIYVTGSYVQKYTYSIEDFLSNTQFAFENVHNYFVDIHAEIISAESNFFHCYMDEFKYSY